MNEHADKIRDNFNKSFENECPNCLERFRLYFAWTNTDTMNRVTTYLCKCGWYQKVVAGVIESEGDDRPEWLESVIEIKEKNDVISKMLAEKVAKRYSGE